MKKYKIKKHTTGMFLITALLMSLYLIACKKDVEGLLPNGQKSAGVNFYAATDVMDAAYGPARGSVAIYLDNFQQQNVPFIVDIDGKFPLFSFGYLFTPQYPISANNRSISYVNFEGSSHRIYLTDINNNPVLDTTVALIPGTDNCLYFADVPAVSGSSSAAYKLVVAEELRNVPEGKTGVRFIHLSPDAGRLTPRLQKSDGSFNNLQMPELTYSTVSEYQYFDVTDAVSGLLRFSLAESSTNFELPSGTPFSPGKSYVIVIVGFRNEQKRKVSTGKNADGSIKIENIDIHSNIRTELRTSY